MSVGVCRLATSGRLLTRAYSSYPAILKGETVRIGCSSGFWGDTSVADTQLINHGKLDFLVSDYLAEITMSLLAAAKRKNPSAGYAPDFITNCIKPNLHAIKKQGVRVITNAGGINPQGCVEMINTVAKSQGVELSVAMVTGDDLMQEMERVKETGLARDISNGRALPRAVLSMNAYLGAFPIAKALNAGADVVITGRCVDSALALGPLIHKFGWKETDYDLLASGSLAGHLIECGAQATGGIYTDWDAVPDWDNIGFPIVECSSDGPFVVTKPPPTGGVVNYGTVAEQLVYEIGDPTDYTLPDVSCDFSNVTLKELKDPHSVLVGGVRGATPPPNYKVSATHLEGYRATAVCVVVGPRARDKAMRTAAGIMKRIRRMLADKGLKDFSNTLVHTIGSGQSYGHAHSESCDSHEITLWLAVQHEQKEALELFSKEIAAAGTGMAPGFVNLIGGRPRVAPVLKLFSFYYPKDNIQVIVSKDGSTVDQPSVYAMPTGNKTRPQEDVPLEQDHSSCPPLEEGRRYSIQELAYLRSGDKGDSCNIGVVARSPVYYPFLKSILTEDFVASVFQHYIDTSEGESPVECVKRYELPGINGLNFVLNRSLGGGGVSSIRVDPQGKAYAQMLGGLSVVYN